MFRAGSELRVIGHRGAAGVAPENTVEAIRRGVRTGARAIEVDVRLSADGRLVVIHDETVDRTTDGRGPVAAMTLDELLRLDAGYRFTPDRGRTFPYRDAGVRVPTLDEAADAASGLPMVVEVKSPAAGEALGAWLRTRRDGASAGRYPSGEHERFIVGGFDRAAVEPAAAEAAWRCATRADLVPFILFGKIGITGPLRSAIDAAMLPIRKGPLRLVTRRFVRRAHERGVGVFVWTVNRPDVMRELFHLGVDGLISDVPARVRRILDERRCRGRD
ncbi:MAG: glycerophosphodiester phosphodiesterase [Gemmatimonadota bacterium]